MTVAPVNTSPTQYTLSHAPVKATATQDARQFAESAQPRDPVGHSERLGRLILAIRNLAKKQSLSHEDLSSLRQATAELAVQLKRANVFNKGVDNIQAQDLNDNLLTDSLRLNAGKLQIRTTHGRDAGWNSLDEANADDLLVAAKDLSCLALGAAGADYKTMNAVMGEPPSVPASVQSWLTDVHAPAVKTMSMADRERVFNQSLAEFNEWGERFKDTPPTGKSDFLQYEQAGMRTAKTILGLGVDADNNKAVYQAYRWINAEGMEDLDYQRFQTGGQDRQDLGVYGELSSEGYNFRQAWLNTSRDERVAMLGLNKSAWDSAEQLVGASFTAHQIRNDMEYGVGDVALVAVASIISAATAGVAAGAMGAAVGTAAGTTGATAGASSAAAGTAAAGGATTVGGVAAKAAVAFARSVAQTFVMTKGDLEYALKNGAKGAVFNILDQGYSAMTSDLSGVQQMTAGVVYEGVKAEMKGGDFTDGVKGYFANQAGHTTGIAATNGHPTSTWDQQLLYNTIALAISSGGDKSAFIQSMIGAYGSGDTRFMSAHTRQFMNADPYEAGLSTRPNSTLQLDGHQMVDASTGRRVDLNWLVNVVAALDQGVGLRTQTMA